ncbi:MAG: helix-turn-helix domain-containing protein [Hyphomonas sp.]
MKAHLRTPADIGTAIRACREARGLNQAELARLAGVGRQWLIQMEKGKPTVLIEPILKTFEALNLKLMALNEVEREQENSLSANSITADINSVIEILVENGQRK